MNVYEEEKYPFLREEDVLLARVVEDEVPFLEFACVRNSLLRQRG